jgi:invasion protein IalB
MVDKSMSFRVPSLRSALVASLVCGVIGTGAVTSAMAQQAAGAATDAAAAATPIGTFTDWQAFEAGDGQKKVCFVISRPKERLPDTLKRDPASFFITHRPGQGVKNEISMTVGFPMKEAQDATIKVGTASFNMFTKDRNAWVRNVTDEPALLDAMRKGRTLTFVAVSRRGNTSTDNYSLAGLSDALDAITQSCGG